MASVRELPLPEETGERGWDSSGALSSLSSHAMAHGSLVCGISSDWKTSFEQEVCCVTSNSSGTIVVAATEGGTISLVRQKDGGVLATRQVSTSEGAAARVSFVQGTNDKDVLIILVPSQVDAPNIILVSNIDGDNLNHDDMEVVKEAAGNMSIDALALDESFRDYVSIKGYFLSGNSVRFMVGEVGGNLSIHDHDLQTKTSVVIKQQLDEDVTFFSSMLGIQSYGNNGHFLLVSGRSESSSKLFWYDLEHLNKTCECVLPISGTPASSKPTILAIEPLSSFSNDSALAVAVIMKDSKDSSSGYVQVLQVIAEEIMGLTVLSHPHKVYHIPLPESLQGIHLSATDGPYSFRFKTFIGSNQFQYSEFVAQDGVIGQVRFLLQQGLYDEADQVLASSGDEAMSTDSFAMFHSSEVALKRLQSLLSSNTVGAEERMEQASECLRRLVAGAVSSKDCGEQYLLEAADSLSSWPTNEAVLEKPTIAEFSTALSAFITAIDTSLETKPEDPSERESKKKELEGRLSALQCIEALVDMDDSTKVPLGPPFLETTCVSDVFCVLMDHGLFSVAEKLWRSEWGRKLTAETLAISLLNLSPSRDPRTYATLLNDAILPRLSVGHEAIPLIRTWACRCADAYDGDENNEFGLDASVFLLENVLTGIQKLNLRIHSSYASYSPFNEKPDGGKSRRTSPKNADSSLAPRTTSFPFEERRTTEAPSPLPDNEHPNPTVLEVSLLKGGAKKSKLRPLASKSGGRASLIDVDDCEENVEIKLTEAKHLRDARNLGLPKSFVTLSQYAREGGTASIAKELVRMHSTSASNHDDRHAAFKSKVKPFCDNAGVDFDQTLVTYNRDLCDSKQVSPASLLESASIARCCIDQLIRCDVALRVLRGSLLCGETPPCLTQLSHDAIEWASLDPKIQSELQEANRLLVVDGIIRKHCGNGARELFKVDHPTHAARLMDFVYCHFRWDSALSDAIDLCNAFTFLSLEEACVRLLQRALAAGEEERCVDLLHATFKLGLGLDGSERVSRRAINYSSQALQDASLMLSKKATGFRGDQLKDRARSACRIGRAILEACQKYFGYGDDNSTLLRSSFATLLRDFKRIQRLQEKHDLFLSLSDLESPKSMLSAARSMLEPAVEAFSHGDFNDGKPLLLEAKSVCDILSSPGGFRCYQSLWYGIAGEAASHLANTFDDGRCMDFLAASGLLDDFGKEDAVPAILSVALTLCQRTSNDMLNNSGRGNDAFARMQDMIRACSLVYDYALIGCPERALVPFVVLGLLTETSSQVLLRADEGLGEALEDLEATLSNEARVRRHNLAPQSDLAEDPHHALTMKGPSLHPKWYVGDGLLLPPRNALSGSVVYCRDILDLCWSSGPTEKVHGPFGLHRFLSDRGAHSVALRSICVYTAMALCAVTLPADMHGDAISDAIIDRQLETLQCLAERSLGGSGTGITSDTIDSQMAVTFLLSLNKRVAFKVYASSLPAAIAKRDFARVIALSNIGVAAGEGSFGWNKQALFVSQCKQRSSRARWWKVLQFYRVEFDPSRFEDMDESTKGLPAYAASLVKELIKRASSVHKDTNVVRDLATSFVKAFGLDADLAAQKHIEYLLSPPQSDIPTSGQTLVVGESFSNSLVGFGGRYADFRFNLDLCEQSARDSLRLIRSPMKRCAVLRKCVIALEGATIADQDYERHSLVLSLYHADLYLASQDSAIREGADVLAFKAELERIGRRSDTLAILSAFFQGALKTHRPAYPKFFLALPASLDVEQKHPEAGPRDIIGVAIGTSPGSFDPLGPLQPFLSRNLNFAAAKALAPLTMPLALPPGSIHARCLIEQFQKLGSGNGTLPSFENDVMPVLSIVKEPSVQSQIAEWCLEYYSDTDLQKLKCLDYGLQCAMCHSSDIEKRLRVQGDDPQLAAEETRALDVVKRLNEMQSILSEKIEVNEILRSVKIGYSQQFRSVEIMFSDLINRVQNKFCTSSDSSPGKIVEMLLLEGSLLASNSCLDTGVSFSISQFRDMASVVHQACKKIADKYPCINPGAISKRLVRRWLVHGDEQPSGDAESSEANEMIKRQPFGDLSISGFHEDEDETVNFVMDLKSLSQPSDDIGSAPAYKNDRSHAITTMVEEPSALKSDGSAREVSESSCTIVALRIAFVMSFAEGGHKTGEMVDEENNVSHANSQATITAGSRKGRHGLLARLGAKDVGARVKEHARELMNIVFAKSGGSDLGTDATMSFLSSNSKDEKSDGQKALTFAMRYRALRAAAILCPQVALDEVAAGYLVRGEGNQTECSLRQASYGAFVAKEIEEMGLPLPHSDLVQLSTMHFPSYARALWRHHRDGDSRGKKGRFLLLLLEMSLKDSNQTDSELTFTLLREMTKLQLPRTLLNGCEGVAKFKLRETSVKSTFLVDDSSDSVTGAIVATADLVLTEIQSSLSSADSSNQYLEDGGLPTLQRVALLVHTFSDCDEQLSRFLKALVELLAFDGNPYSETLVDIALNTASCFTDAEPRRQFYKLLRESPSGQAALARRRGGSILRATEYEVDETPTELTALLQQVEISFDPLS